MSDNRQTRMKREIAEQIIEAMKGMDQAFGRLDAAISQIENEEERRRMARVLGGFMGDSYYQITRPVVVQFPDLHPDSPPNWRPSGNFRPGLPVRRIDPGPRLSEATLYDDRMYLSGMIPEDTSQDITGQTKQALAEIDSLLAKGGSGKTKIL